MNSRVTAVLEKFAQNAKLSKSDMLDSSKVLQRYMAVHVNIAPVEMTYSLIADDYKMIELKAESPPLKVYRSGTMPIDIETFIVACKHMESGNISQSLDEFRQVVLSRPVEEEQWKRFNSPDLWKEKAYFMALNFKDMKNIVEAVYDYPNKTISAEPGFIYNRMALYEARQKPGQLAHDIGRMIASIKIEHEDVSSPLTASTSPPLLDLQFKMQEEPQRKKSSSKIIVEHASETTTKESFATLRPQMEAYRKRAGLNATIDAKKLARQIIYAASDMPHERVPEEILGRFQKKLTAVNEEEKCIALKCIDAFTNVPKSFDANNCERAKIISSLTRKKQWNAKGLLKAIIVPQAFLEKSMYDRYEKQGVHNNFDQEIATAIADLE